MEAHESGPDHDLLISIDTKLTMIHSDFKDHCDEDSRRFALSEKN